MVREEKMEEKKVPLLEGQLGVWMEIQTPDDSGGAWRVIIRAESIGAEWDVNRGERVVGEGSSREEAVAQAKKFFVEQLSLL